MANQDYFSSTKTVYWPAEFLDISNMLQGKDSTENITHPAMYKLNTGPIVLAAVIGLVNNRERDVGSMRKDILTDTFEGQKFGNTSLAAFLFLIPLLAKQDLDLLRPEREDEVVRIFERFAAGGFEYLRGALSESSDTTGQAVLNAEVMKALGSIDDLTDTGLVDIFSGAN
jgi:hypothetical protein